MAAEYEIHQISSASKITPEYSKTKKEAIIKERN